MQGTGLMSFIRVEFQWMKKDEKLGQRNRWHHEVEFQVENVRFTSTVGTSALMEYLRAMKIKKKKKNLLLEATRFNFICNFYWFNFSLGIFDLYI